MAQPPTGCPVTHVKQRRAGSPIALEILRLHHRAYARFQSAATSSGPRISPKPRAANNSAPTGRPRWPRTRPSTRTHSIQCPPGESSGVPQHRLRRGRWHRRSGPQRPEPVAAGGAVYALAEWDRTGRRGCLNGAAFKTAAGVMGRRDRWVAEHAWRRLNGRLNGGGDRPFADITGHAVGVRSGPPSDDPLQSVEPQKLLHDVGHGDDNSRRASTRYNVGAQEPSIHVPPGSSL